MTSTPVHARGLLDTSAVISLPRLRPDSLPEEPLISTITLAELSVGTLLATSDEERIARQMHVQQAEADFDAIPFDAAAARAFAGVAFGLRRAGRTTKARAFDALIASVARAHDLPLYTANARDFDGIDGLVVVPIVAG